MLVTHDIFTNELAIPKPLICNNNKGDIQHWIDLYEPVILQQKFCADFDVDSLNTEQKKELANAIAHFIYHYYVIDVCNNANISNSASMDENLFLTKAEAQTCLNVAITRYNEGVRLLNFLAKQNSNIKIKKLSFKI